jgi:methylmalonyl-CoA/ethylmalonyl-CoA epimerase
MFEIDHVAHVVEDVDMAKEAFVDTAGAEHVWTYKNEEWQYRTAYMLAGSDMFTLIAPLSDESFIADYLKHRGPSLHHIGVNVENLESTVSQLTAAGGEVIMEDTIPGVRDEATLHPQSWFGLQLQVIEWHDEVGSSARDHIKAMRDAHE